MDKTLQQLQLGCRRCGHRWLRRKLELPEQCPACHSSLWNKARVRYTAASQKAAYRGKNANHGTQSDDGGAERTTRRRIIRANSAIRAKRPGTKGGR